LVEVTDRDKKYLRDRVLRLTAELDRCETRLEEATRLLASVAVSLAGLLKPELGGRGRKALKKLKSAAGAKRLKLEAIHEAVDAFKSAVLTDRGSEKKPEAAPQVEEDAAGRHVALALLEGLRLGDKDFDQSLERDIQQIQAHIAKGEVRPAMGLTIDLLDRYRQVYEKRQVEAEQALKDLVLEVFRTEEELTKAFEEANSTLEHAGREFQARIDASVGGLARAIDESTDLAELKARAVEHLRQIRDEVKARRALERDLLVRTRRQLEVVRGTLGGMRERLRQLEETRQRLSQEALTDPLTRVWNKRALTHHLKEALAAPQDRPLSLIVFDIDNFKGINDTYGHQAGDKALVAIAERAGSCLRRMDVLFRYAGDEFVVLLTQAPLATGKEVAERIRRATETIRFTYRGKGELRITTSLGVTESRPGDTPTSFFERADGALYEAKRGGRNRVVAA
jgi:diguanylate cyclase